MILFCRYCVESCHSFALSVCLSRKDCANMYIIITQLHARKTNREICKIPTDPSSPNRHCWFSVLVSLFPFVNTICASGANTFYSFISDRFYFFYLNKFRMEKSENKKIVKEKIRINKMCQQINVRAKVNKFLCEFYDAILSKSTG